LLNKFTSGQWLKFRSFLSYIVRDDINYYLDGYIGRELYLTGRFERRELELCKDFIKEDSIVIDVGANIGIHSIYFSKLASKGLVLSIEPQTTIFPLLIKNTLKYNNIIPLNIAIDYELKISSFYIMEDNAYSSLKDTKRKNIVDIRKVITIPLDNFMVLFDKIDFIKIDVEGLEKNVILSMLKILEYFKPVLFIEIYKGNNSNMDPEGTIKILLEMGYQAYVVDNQGELDEFTGHKDDRYNYFFIY